MHNINYVNVTIIPKICTSHLWQETGVIVNLLSFLEVQVVRSHQLVQETPKSI